MSGKGKREHFVFIELIEVFESEAFEDLSAKMIQHLSVKEKNDPNKLGTLP